MRRFLQPLAALLLLAVIALGGFYVANNPEHVTLDQAARDSVSGSYVTLGDGVTHYEATGATNAPTVVLVHGFSVPYYIWDSTVAPLRAAGYRVIRYDMYGRGYSDRPDVTYDAALFVRQLDQLLDRLDVHQPVDLVGVSMGGWVTSSYVAAHPTRVRSLTLVDPVAQSGEVPGIARVPLIGPLLFQTLAVPKMAAGQLDDFVHPEHFPDWDDRYVPQTRYRGFSHALLSTRTSMSHAGYDSLYARVASTGMPVLLVWGREDRSVPFPLSARVRQRIPRAQFLPVDSAGHLPIVERASVVNPVLLRFLADSTA
jgi:pimeloyl-ACP methyl ester carboxylesterase